MKTNYRKIWIELMEYLNRVGNAEHSGGDIVKMMRMSEIEMMREIPKKT